MVEVLSDKSADRRIRYELDEKHRKRQEFIDRYAEPFGKGPIEEKVDRICGKYDDGVIWTTVTVNPPPACKNLKPYERKDLITDPYYEEMRQYCMEYLGERMFTPDIVRHLIMAKDYGKVPQKLLYDGVYHSPRALQLIFDNFKGGIKGNVVWCHDRKYDGCYDKIYSDSLSWVRLSDIDAIKSDRKNPYHQKRYEYKKITYQQLLDGEFRDWSPPDDIY